MADNSDLTKEQLDFVTEMMSIGAGNAAAALSQFLNRLVDITIPSVKFNYAEDILGIFKEPSMPVLAVKMHTVGDIISDLFYIVPAKNKNELIELVQKATPGEREEQADISTLTEFASILAGVYLTAIHDFVKLNIFHSVSKVAEDMLQSILDESISKISNENQRLLMAENVFLINGQRSITTYFLIIPSLKSLPTLLNSIKRAR